MNRLAGPSSLWKSRPGVLLAITCVLVAGCHSHKATQAPSLQLTRVPPATPGGPDTLDYIEGRADGASPDQQIVLYAHSGIWWIQPFVADPFTRIQPDSTWKNSTHLGMEYAALLVEPGYHPQAKIASLPAIGKGVVAIVTAKGEALAPIVSKVLHFSGYDWTVRGAGSERGGEMNSYDPANAWTDQKGYLHLRMTPSGDRWSCAEVFLTRSLGYGTYRFVVQDSAHLAPFATVGMFTYDDAGVDDAHRELDIELSRWGNPAGKNAQYVVQPFYVPENVSTFTVPAGILTHVFRWEPGSVSFQTISGSVVRPASKAIGEHTFTSGIPAPGAEMVHINLYNFHQAPDSSQRPAEVVLEKFEYLP